MHGMIRLIRIRNTYIFVLCFLLISTRIYLDILVYIFFRLFLPLSTIFIDQFISKLPQFCRDEQSIRAILKDPSYDDFCAYMYIYIYVSLRGRERFARLSLSIHYLYIDGKRRPPARAADRLKAIRPLELSRFSCAGSFSYFPADRI